MKSTERLIFHIDVNSAFLSWESARRVSQGLPDLREIPSCVGGNPKKRTGIVVAKSIPAKKIRDPDRRASSYGSSEMSQFGDRSQ